jgi:hypothetical protein
MCSSTIVVEKSLESHIQAGDRRRNGLTTVEAPPRDRFQAASFQRPLGTVRVVPSGLVHLSSPLGRRSSP